jgi:hypothetical protein
MCLWKQCDKNVDKVNFVNICVFRQGERSGYQRALLPTRPANRLSSLARAARLVAGLSLIAFLWEENLLWPNFR